MLLALLTLLATPVAPRPFGDERLLLDRRLETLRRILPDGPNPAADAALAKELAEGARLASVEALARPPAESTSARADVVVDVSAVGRYAEVDRFVRQVALSPRPIDVESLSVTATPDAVVKLDAVLRLPYRPLRAPLPAPPDGTRARLQGVPRAQADAYVRDMSLALAKSETVATLRRTRRNPRLFLSELAAIVRDRPVVLTHASVGDDFVVRGLTVGEGPVRALESRFERGFLRVSDFVMARQGACLRFEVRGKSPVVGPDAELPLPTEDPFDQDDAPCKVDRDSVRTVVVKGPSTKTPGQGPLSLRLRDVDLTDVFFVLHWLTRQGFLVDGDVTGRVSVELNRVTLEEALAALAKGAGLRVSEPSLVRRVSLARGTLPPSESKRGAKGKAPATGPSPAPLPAGPPATFLLKRADVRDILAAMTDADPSLAALGPQGFLGRVSVWAKDVPLGTCRARSPRGGRAHGARGGRPPDPRASSRRGRGARSGVGGCARSAAAAASPGSCRNRVRPRGPRRRSRGLDGLRLHPHRRPQCVSRRGSVGRRRRQRRGVHRRDPEHRRGPAAPGLEPSAVEPHVRSCFRPGRRPPVAWLECAPLAGGGADKMRTRETLPRVLTTLLLGLWAQRAIRRAQIAYRVGSYGPTLPGGVLSSIASPSVTTNATQRL